MAEQTKGLISFVWGGVTIKNLAEGSISYDIGERGDTLSATDAVVHIKRNKNAIVTSVTVNIVKGTSGLNALLLAIQSDINSPLTINDSGVGFKGAMASANATQITLGDSTGTADVETVSVIFKGNLQILSLEK